MERNRYSVRSRSSVRSRESSSTTTSDPKEKVKDCCRKLIAFMCTQVGVGGLIVVYAMAGAFSIMSIEIERAPKINDEVANLRNETMERIWNATDSYNTLDPRMLKIETNRILRDYQEKFAKAVKKGYDGRNIEEIWTFPASLMYCLSVFTMIGYGNLLPRSDAAKVATIVYATFGIPLYILYFLNMGKVLANTFKWIYRRFYACAHGGNSAFSDAESASTIRRKVIVPSTACLWVISGYVATGTIMFAEWEKWSYLNSLYFCVTSLCKIGFGDFVPGANVLDAQTGKQTKLVINFVYLLFGMGIVAMCYNLMREEVKVKLQEIKEDTRICMDDVKAKCTGCMGKDEEEEEYYFDF